MAIQFHIHRDHALAEGSYLVVNLRQAFRGSVDQRDTSPLRLVVYLTGGPEDARLLEVIRQKSERPSTHITLTYVVEVQQSMPLDAELPAEILRGEQVLREAERFATNCVGGKRENVATELLQARVAGAAIVDQAIDENADAIILACSIRKKHGKFMISDAVQYVMLNAPCEVHVIRAATHPEVQQGINGS